MMLSAGAYSKKYQQLERDRVQHLRDQERKATRERTLLLSKQTAQRRKALEEKKRAMAIAEEQRRRKALEERRKAQHEATARFKSAICRMKSNPHAKHKPGDHVEIYLPDKAKPKAKNSVSTQNGQSQRRSNSSTQQRVAYGKDVEIKSEGRAGLQGRTPSLDDVLNQIRGGDSSTLSNDHPPLNTHTHGRINVHRTTTSTVSQHQATNIGSRREQRTSPMLKGRSASDPNLNSLTTRSSISGSKEQDGGGSMSEADRNSSEDASLKVVEVEVSPSDSNELMLFKPITNVGGARMYTTLTAVANRMMKSDDGTRVLSPEPADSSNSSDRSFSPPLNDSLDQPASRYVVTSVAKQIKASRQQQEQAVRQSVKLTPQKRTEREDNRQNSSLKVTGISATAHTPHYSTSQPIYVCESSDSSNDIDGDTDSLDEEGTYTCRRATPLNSRSQKNLHQPTVTKEMTSLDEPGVAHTDETQNLNNCNTDEVTVTDSKPKIVGILKKTSTPSVEQSQTGLSMNSSAPLERPQSGVESCLTSTSISSTRSQKRVRFLDQVGSNNGHGHAPHNDNMWTKVLPNSFKGQHLPNSAFTPKMRVFLTSNATVPPAPISGPPKRPTSSSTVNGITVRVPVASVESPSSPKHHQQAQNSPQHGDTRRAQNEAQKQNGGNVKKSDNLSKNIQVNGTSSPIHEQDTSSSSLSGDESYTVEAAPIPNKKALDKTPTDNEINEMWQQIRTCLDDNKQSTVPVQPYPFQMPVNGMQRYASPSSVYLRDVETDTSAVSLQRNLSAMAAPQQSEFHGHQQAHSRANDQNGVRLVHRQANRSRPMRCHHQAHVHAPSQHSRRQQSSVHHGHSATYPYSDQEQPHAHRQYRGYPPGIQTSTQEPELVVRATASTINGRTTPTSLSLEEQRLLHSIEKLNQRLKDHLVLSQEPAFQPPPSPDFDPPSYSQEYYHHPPRHLPPHPPHNSRSRGHTDVPKQSGIHWQQATPQKAAAVNSRRIKTNRQIFT